jgi:hypothetical protein
MVHARDGNARGVPPTATRQRQTNPKGMEAGSRGPPPAGVAGRMLCRRYHRIADGLPR